MKKQLLLGSLLFAAVSAFPQQGKVKPAGTVDMAAKLHQKMLRTTTPIESSANSNNSAAVNNPQPELAAVSTASATWNIIGGSRNLYGVLVSEQRPLQYNAALNAVSFIHRCSSTYSASPADNTGAIVAEISTNWGATWDSTCIWSDATNQGRYPGGGIYNPIGNTNINNAYIVGAGPTTNGAGWQGSYFASKQLGSANYNSTASSVPNAMQWVNNTAPLSHPAVGKVDFPRYCFTSTTDGKVRAVGTMVNDINNTSSNSGYGYRGMNLVKGSFNAGVFNWEGDSIMFAGIVNMNTEGTPATSDDYFMTYGSPMLAFNEAGTHGYAFTIGVRATPSNSQSAGYQPIVWRTADGGGTWALMPGIDFSSPTYSWVLSHIPSVSSNTNLTIPQFNASEGLGAVVDANNKLHLFSTIVGTSRSHPDSVGSSYNFTMSVNSPTATYAWGHVPGERPYLYDFILDGATSTWSYKLIDSMSTEAPSGTSGEGGFSENPFDEDAGTKQVSDARIQASRTVDGKYVIVSWAESDTNFVNGGVKYNVIPDIKARLIDVDGTSSGTPYFLSPTEINVSKLGAHPQVEKKAVMHYMSPVSGSISLGTGSAVNSTLTIPFTVTHSQGPGAQPGTIFAGLTSNAHWYASASLNFDLKVVGIKENALQSVQSAVIFPNPASGSAVLAIDMKDNAAVAIDVYSTVGQLVKSSKANAQIGDNQINFDLTNLAPGIYMVNVKVGNAVSTKKLIVQ